MTKIEGWLIAIWFGTAWIVLTVLGDLFLALNGYNIPLMLSWVYCMVGVAIVALGAVFGMSSKVMF